MARALIVGAGVVGLAVARSLASQGHEVIVAEAGPAIGGGVSSRNSGVIHAGLYYPTGSLRHRLCVEGRRALYAFAQSHGVAHRRLGKLIVATEPGEEEKLDALLANGRANGVEGLAACSAAEARRLEPALSCAAALLSAETGVIDAPGLMLALRGEIEDHGGAIALATPVPGAERIGDLWRIRFGGVDAGVVEAELLVVAAGLRAQAVAAAIAGLDPAAIPPLILAKGSYFAFSGRAPFTRLIYPAPIDGGLGVHVTLDLAGRMRFGPDVEWIDAEDYRVSAARRADFEARIRRYWPQLPAERLVPDYAGIRPKLTGPGAPAADFRILGPADHGLAGLVCLFGIESPGLTSALALGDHVAALLD
ncbi:L-2-hydroxyglutarate oxidase LhgO [Methylosinus sp. sav-2]|uniref:NAD(P)/FAD-dependent oxidoreductase n=1 Tax=Methylosinus sp. sav-2 TaxID=2485168 RepID=UPI000479E716|nr:NAD(P)/FAD-dependent oxidoreductase [Methylosinus sp. sav-2]TDX63425.1 L-2-hydroxyglutarate oxidase LhgO [Methylosinus sp. sav-2]